MIQNLPADLEAALAAHETREERIQSLATALQAVLADAEPTEALRAIGRLLREAGKAAETGPVDFLARMERLANAYVFKSAVEELAGKGAGGGWSARPRPDATKAPGPLLYSERARGLRIQSTARFSSTQTRPQ